jgi:hypothetical protein
MGNIIMSLKEKEQVMVFDQLKRKEISQSVAAQILNVSPRWISEKQKRYLADGIQGVLHKNRGKPSSRAWNKSEREFSIKLFSGDFKDFGPMYGAEKLEELWVEVKHARSPQAKGRVERVNQTLQDRLTEEMRLAGISTIEAANAFAQGSYIDRHNQKFAEEAAQPGNAHRPVAGLDLHNVFCIKVERVLQQDFTLSYEANHGLKAVVSGF